jgi:hypothetical protein
MDLMPIRDFRQEYYDFYYPQFNVDRVLKKLQADFNRRKYQKKMSQHEF